MLLVQFLVITMAFEMTDETNGSFSMKSFLSVLKFSYISPSCIEFGHFIHGNSLQRRPKTCLEKQEIFLMSFTLCF